MISTSFLFDTPGCNLEKKTVGDSKLKTDRPWVPISCSFPKVDLESFSRLGSFKNAAAHYPPSDFPLFSCGYLELCREDLSGKTAVELACGRGDLAVALAEFFPKARIIAVDRYPEAGAAIREAHQSGKVPNLEYLCADASDLSTLPGESADLIFGQAALHHLANDINAIRSVTGRILKPGGRLIFLFEPLGHNWVVACVRAIQISRHTMADESNLFFPTFQEIGRPFSKIEVQSFNLCGYALKGLKGNQGIRLAKICNALDRGIAKIWRQAPKFGANANIIFWK